MLSVSMKGPHRSIAIGDRDVGMGHPAYIVAEIGINHNGDMSLARRTIDAARDAGADAVKFQNYRTQDFLSTDALTITYESVGGSVTEPQRDLFERCELSDEDVRELAAYCASSGIDFHSTPTHEAGITLLMEAGAQVLKNGSDFLSHTPLVAAMAQSGLPTVLSTGMATIADIDEAVRAFRSNGGEDLILLHCVSQYPAPAAELNLQRMGVLAEVFGTPVGFSDHSDGTLGASLAAAHGACWIEKHFTLDKTLPGPDHRFSSDKDEMLELVSSIRLAEQMMGDGQVGRRSSNEATNGNEYRLSCAAGYDLKSGTVLGKEHIAFFRPGTGLKPAQCELLVGRVLTTDLKRGDIIDLSDIR